MLFVGDDWAEDHHDVEVVDDDGRVLARRRLPNGLDGVAASACVDRRAAARGVGRLGAGQGGGHW